ncbi:hypothetical protein CTAYLR_004623 [Chrysophaeum taylorii]|uniref:Glycosyl transferase CAP10 domain-containing protein n=1 Tax=Chrysophaeum taylorii TaxID=2483200 RepID=A0AAD7XUK4_9STRA|nr:hypothetical protein CTAYLR_004623 [Chrysophaeum taylorii]
MFFILQLVGVVVVSQLDERVDRVLGKVLPAELEQCVLSHLYLLRWDHKGIPSAYGLQSQRNCVGTADNHKRDRKLGWTKKTIQRVREATSVYTEDTPLVPIARRLSNKASLWWADDFLLWVNNLECVARIFVFTANVSQPCQVLVPALFEYDLAQEQVYRLRRSDEIGVPWVSRRPQLFYRGKDYAPESCAMFFPSGYRPRRKLELLSRRYPEIINASIHKEDAVDLARFARYRYIMDIGGVSCTTWSALHWKLSSGSLVLVVEHPGGLLNWWMRHRLKPWIHYVPVKPDYSDLFTTIKYFEHNVDEAIKIAASGQRAALEYTQTAAFGALAGILLDSLAGPDPPLLHYPGEPSRETWYCAIGPDPACEIRHV